MGRDAVKMTRRAVADALGVTESTVYRWETGDAEPRTLGEFDRLAGLYGVRPEWLVYGVDSEDAPPYESWEVFTKWLETAAERAIVEPWMLDELRRLRTPPDKKPRVEFYQRALLAMLSTESDK